MGHPPVSCLSVGGYHQGKDGPTLTNASHLFTRNCLPSRHLPSDRITWKKFHKDKWDTYEMVEVPSINMFTRLKTQHWLSVSISLCSHARSWMCWYGSIPLGEEPLPSNAPCYISSVPQNSQHLVTDVFIPGPAGDLHICSHTRTDVSIGQCHVEY